MRYRLLLAFLLVPAACYIVVVIGGGAVSRNYIDEASAQAATTLRLAVSALGGHLSRYEPLPELIADHEIIEELVGNPGDTALRESANRYLKSINTLLESSDIYVITPSGETIAASNYDRPTSFIGENFNYRPYFQEAARGLQSRFYALGTTSLKRGYYFSSPIDVGGRILGVIVFKVDIDVIETSWGSDEYRIFVSDPEGIVFMTGNQEWLYTAILPLTPERLERTQASRRYADAPLRELPVRRGVFEGHDTMTVSDTGHDREYLMLSHYMPQADWTVNVLMDTASVRTRIKTTIVAALLFLCLAGLAIAILLQRRVRLRERMLLQVRTRDELERRVVERTAALERVNRQIEQEISERRMTETRLRQTQSDLIQAGKLAGLGQMSAALSHELNQPLAAAKTYADSAALLIERGRIDEASDNVRRISRLVDRMASISKHLRHFARKPNEKLSAVSIADVIDDTLEIVAARVKVAKATLEIDLGAPELFVLAGPVRLQQVLVNVITNAADAVEGLEDRRIFVTAQKAGEKVRIVVRDHGPGVPPAISERIFDPFFTTKGVGKGLGLGLSISYNIVKDFGGALSVTNHESGGAEFVIELHGADSTTQEAAQ